MTPIAQDPVEAALAVGLKNLWYPIWPSSFVNEQPVSLKREPQARGLARCEWPGSRTRRPLPASGGAVVAGRRPRRSCRLPLPRCGGSWRRHGDARARQPRLQARRLAADAGTTHADLRRCSTPSSTPASPSPSIASTCTSSASPRHRHPPRRVWLWPGQRHAESASLPARFKSMGIRAAFLSAAMDGFRRYRRPAAQNE